MRRALALLSLWLAAGPAAAQQPTPASVRSDIASELADNERGAITAAHLRGVLFDMVDITPDGPAIRTYISPWAWSTGASGQIETPRLAAGGTTGDVLARTASGQAWTPFGPVIDMRIQPWARVTGQTGNPPANLLGSSWTGAGAFLMSPSVAGSASSWAFLAASDIRSGTFADARLPAGIARDTELPAANELLTAAMRTQLGWLPSSICTNNQILKSNGTAFVCAADAVGAGGGIDQDAATALIAEFARAGSTSGTIPTARLATGGTTGQFLRKTATAHAFESVTIPAAPASFALASSPSGQIPPSRVVSAAGTAGQVVQLAAGGTSFQYASIAPRTTTFIDGRIAPWAKANSPTDTIPVARFLTGGSSGNLVERTGTGMRWRTPAQVVDVRVEAFAHQGNAAALTPTEIPARILSNDVTRDAEIPAALFASGTLGFGTAVRGGCLRHDGGSTYTRDDFGWIACPTGGTTLTRTIAATQPTAAVTTSNIGTTRTAWQTLMESAAITAAQAASGIDVEVSANGSSSAGAGGGDRIYAFMRIVRVRSSVSTSLLPVDDVDEYVRNSGQMSADANAASRRAGFNIRIAVDASDLAADDVIRVEVAAIAQVAGKTVTWPMADSRLKIISWS